MTSRKTFNTFSLPLQWDDETDMAKMEECVRSVQMDGLVWGASKLVPVGYGIKKLQIQCVVEDDKVGTDILEEEITKFEDYVSIFLEPFCSLSAPHPAHLEQLLLLCSTWAALVWQCMSFNPGG